MGISTIAKEIHYIKGGSDVRKTVCNFCGKEFDEWDNQEGFGFTHRVGFGSKFDGQVIEVDLCCDCFDKMMEEYVFPNCQLNCISDDDEETPLAL